MLLLELPPELFEQVLGASAAILTLPELARARVVCRKYWSRLRRFVTDQV